MFLATFNVHIVPFTQEMYCPFCKEDLAEHKGSSCPSCGTDIGFLLSAKGGKLFPKSQVFHKCLSLNVLFVHDVV